MADWRELERRPINERHFAGLGSGWVFGRLLNEEVAWMAAAYWAAGRF